MIRHSRFIFLTIALLLTLVVSLARPMAVYADDGTPPPPATQEPTREPTDLPTEEVPVEVAGEVTSTEVAVDTSDIAVDSSLNTDSESVPVSEILEAAPEGTQVVVLDDNGALLPLVSEDAAVIVATTDPMWCPAGTLPGGAGCTINFATPQALIDDMDNSNPSSTNSIYEQDGIIYFTANPGGDFILAAGSGNALSTVDYDILQTYNLTLQGGWNGLNDGSGFALGGQTDFGANVVQVGSVGNPWGGNITINNISIDGASVTGLTVYTDGDIILNSVESQNNTGYGARLDNDSGTGTVTVQNSSFDNNAIYGVRVLSNGNIALANVTAQGNGDSGASLDNTTGSGSINISSTTLSGNVSNGVYAVSNGDITLLNVIVDNNNNSGAYLENITGTGNISISATTAGGSSFSGNSVDGLEAYSNGDITVTNVAANFNAEIGFSLANDTGEGNVFVSNSTFDSNTSTGQDMGLEISSGGDVTLDTVSASSNLAGNGAFISGSSLLVQNSSFNNNASADQAWGQGLYVEGDEAEIICSQFNGNSAYGIDGINVPALTLDDVTFSGNVAGDYTGSPTIASGGCTPDDGGGDEGEGDEGGGEEGDPSVSEDTSPDITVDTGLPLHIVELVGDERIELDCHAFSGTRLILPSGDNVTLPCPIQDQAFLKQYLLEELPHQLEEQYGFLSAIDAEVIRGNKFVSSLDGSMIIDFVIPGGQDETSLSILHWDGSQWSELPHSYVSEDGFFESTTDLTGIFVLVTK